jgi:hypothetical protein
MTPAIDQMITDWEIRRKLLARRNSAGLVPLCIQAEGASIGCEGMAIVVWVLATVGFMGKDVARVCCEVLQSAKLLDIFFLQEMAGCFVHRLPI